MIPNIVYTIFQNHSQINSQILKRNVIVISHSSNMIDIQVPQTSIIGTNIQFLHSNNINNTYEITNLYCIPNIKPYIKHQCEILISAHGSDRKTKSW